MTHHTLASADGKVVLDCAIGHIATLDLPAEGGPIAPLHRAPWADEAGWDDQGLAPGIRGLSGDFFCAPFGPSDIDGSEGHGWPANSPWRLLEETHNGATHSASFELEHRVQNGRLCKRLTLRDGEPFLYQTHSFIGGSGRISVAHHPMIHLATTGRLSVSPKAWAETVEPWPEMAVALGYPARSTDLARFPGADGNAVDLTRLPLAQTNVDLVMLVEAQGTPLGWTALARESEGDTILILKDPAVLPVTMVWTSNGGRAGPPWNGRHRGVIGIEDGATYAWHGHAASIAANPLADAGIATAIGLDPDGTVEIRHMIGAFRHSGSAPAIRSVVASDTALFVTAIDGSSYRLACDGTFLLPHH